MRNLEHSLVRTLYAPHVSIARRRILQDSAIATVVASDADPDLVLGFLIQFCALGVEMTRSVESWIEQAGRRCEELGHVQLGRALVLHARHEAGHHTLLIDDLELLVRRWNSTHPECLLDCAQLLALPMTAATREYVALHEATIRGPAPFGQIAIELEVEGMSVVLGPVLLDACSRALGLEIVRELSFIREHVALDVGHTAMNEAELEKFLQRHPDQAESLAEVGGAGLHLYLDFLGECVELAGSRIHGQSATLGRLVD